MSRISRLRSMTFTLSRPSSARCCAGDSSSSATSRSKPVSRLAATSSSALPLPMYQFGSTWRRFCHSAPTTSAPAVVARLASSVRESSAVQPSSEPVSTATRKAFSTAGARSIMSLLIVCKGYRSHRNRPFAPKAGSGLRRQVSLGLASAPNPCAFINWREHRIMHRPIGVTLLAVGAGLAALFEIWRTLVFLGIANFTFIGQPVEFKDPQWGQAFWAIVLAAIWIWIAEGFWNVRAYAWSFGIFISLFTIIFGFFAILGGAGTMESETVGWFLAIVIFMYLNYPGVRGQFEAKEMSLLTPEQKAALEQMQAAQAQMAAATAATAAAPTPPPAAPPAPPAS